MSTGRSFALGLIGFPVGHSRSPAIQNAALQAQGLAGHYDLFAVPPLPDGLTLLRDLLERVRQGEIHGLNVTIPHKQSVIPLLDELTPAARSIGAVNVIYMQAGRLWGDNTDAPGFLADLAKFAPGASGRALVLGAGGGARAVVYALAGHWEVSLAARRLEQAEPFRQLGASRILELAPADLASAGVCELLVNATPLGMHPAVDGCPWPADLPLPYRARIYDLIYNPPQTRLLQRAALSGLACTNGMGMLVEQAALAFERWTGASAPRLVMQAALQRQLLPG